MCLILLQDTMASKLDLISASGQSTNKICVVNCGGSDVLDLSVNSVFVRISFFVHDFVIRPFLQKNNSVSLNIYL